MVAVSANDFLRGFGLHATSPQVTAEMTATTWSARWAERARLDLRYAARGLARSPGFATTVALTFALGVGANAAIFSLIDPLLVRNPAGVVEPNGVHRVYYAGISGAPS